MAKITRSRRAKADVLSIGRRIAEQSQSRAIAYRFLDKIDQKIKFLARHCLAGEARPDLAANVRVFSVGNYVIFYRPADDGSEVLRVLHGARDIPRVFRTGENQEALTKPPR
jgi:toxin ParE1/3/4